MWHLALFNAYVAFVVKPAVAVTVMTMAQKLVAREGEQMIDFIRRKILTLLSPMEMPNRILQSRKRLMLGIPPNPKTILQKS